MKKLLSALFVLTFPVAASAQIGTSTQGDTSTGSPETGTGPESGEEVEFVDPNAAPQVVHAPSLDGSTGLYRVWEAGGLRAGEFGLGLHGEYFSGSDVVRTGDEDRRFIGHIALSWTILDYLELFGHLWARSNINDYGDPELIQSVGNSSLGLKAFQEVSPGLSLGGQLRLTFPAGANNVGLDLGATSIETSALLTADLRELADDTPMRFHLNLGYLADNSEKVFGDLVLARVERFGHDVFAYDRFRIGMGLDVPLDWVSPFLEYTLDAPVSAPCDTEIDQACVSDGGFSAWPSFLTIGVRGAPTEGLSLTAGVDLGMTTKESQGTPAVPAWNAVFGITYVISPTTRVEYVAQRVEVPVEVPVGAVTSHVEGHIVDSATGAPVANARVRYLDTPYTDQITGDDGNFRTFDFEPGTRLVIEISHPEYTTRAMEVAITEEVLTGEIPLEQAILGTRLVGAVSGSDGVPLEATVSLRGATSHDITADATGAFQVDVDPGEYTLTVSAPGRVSTRERFVARPGRQELSWRLVPLDAGVSVRLSGDLIVFDGAEDRVDFEGRQISDGGRALLDQVASLLQQYSELRLLVRAHTDDNGDPDGELATTEQRAQAVVDYLAEHGIIESRLQAEGAGASEPLFPNLSDRNRRRNNRVEFVILGTATP